MRMPLKLSVFHSVDTALGVFHKLAHSIDEDLQEFTKNSDLLLSLKYQNNQKQPT